MEDEEGLEEMASSVWLVPVGVGTSVVGGMFTLCVGTFAGAFVGER